MLQRFNMPTQTIPMLSKKPKKATNDLHKDILGTRNPGLGYMAKRAQPVLYMRRPLLSIPINTSVSNGIVKEVLVHQVGISMKKDERQNPGHVRRPNDFYAKANALYVRFLRRICLDQAYWLSANEIASKLVTTHLVLPFVHKSRLTSQVPLGSLEKLMLFFIIGRSNGHTVADSIGERLKQPTAYKFKTDCSISLLGNAEERDLYHQTHAHIHTTVSEVIKKVFIQGFRTISENQCLLQILKVTMIGRRDIIKAFKDSNRYEHVRLKISVWQSLSERRSQSNSKK
ncbi:hypothetical protein Tco_0585265 [Tanacetum coccineum]